MFQLFKNRTPARNLLVAQSLNLDKVFQSLPGTLVLAAEFVASQFQLFARSFQVILLKSDSAFEQRSLFPQFRLCGVALLFEFFEFTLYSTLLFDLFLLDLFPCASPQVVDFLLKSKMLFIE